MPRRACIAVTAAASVALALPGAALSRRHRVHSVAPPLPHAAAVDEQEWSVQPSQTVLAAGRITFTGYDRGQDAHNMAIIGPHGQIAAIAMKPGGSGTLTETLAPGTYQLVCTLYAGTPQSHEALGMHATITVR